MCVSVKEAKTSKKKGIKWERLILLTFLLAFEVIKNSSFFPGNPGSFEITERQDLKVKKMPNV